MKFTYLVLFSILSFAYSCGDDSFTEYEPAADNSRSSSTTTGVSRLSVVGKNLVNSAGQITVLKGVSYGWHNWEAFRFYNASTVSTFATDWNCNVVRASMGIEPVGAYLTDKPKGITCVTTIVDAAIANDIYAIIDWHCHSILEADAKEFFELMAEKYKGKPNVIYEIFNEPATDGPGGFGGTDLTWSAIKAYAIEVIKVIRAIDPLAIIIVGTPVWAQDVDEVSLNPITGYSNLLYTLHFYAGAHGQSLRNKANIAISRGLPIFVTECGGMNADGDGPINQAEWSRWLTWMQQNNISWTSWAINDKDETCSMLKTSASSTGNWLDSQISPWGLVVKDQLVTGIIPTPGVLWEGSKNIGTSWGVAQAVSGDLFPTTQTCVKVEFTTNSDVPWWKLKIMLNNSSWTPIDIPGAGTGTSAGVVDVSAGQTSFTFCLDGANLANVQANGLLIGGYGITITKIYIVDCVGDLPAGVVWQGNDPYDLGCWGPLLDIPGNLFTKVGTYKIEFTKNNDAPYWAIKLMYNSSWHILPGFDTMIITETVNELFITLNASNLALIQANSLSIGGCGLYITKVTFVGP